MLDKTAVPETQQTPRVAKFATHVQSDMQAKMHLNHRLVLTACLASSVAAFAGSNYVLFSRDLIENRVKSFSRNDTKREEILKNMFVIIVGAHFDHVDAGDGVVDNWSGASLLPTLYQGLRTTPRQHTFIFVSFSGEEKGELGSRAYVSSMSDEDVQRTSAMVNMDTLGLGRRKFGSVIQTNSSQQPWQLSLTVLNCPLAG